MVKLNISLVIAVLTVVVYISTGQSYAGDPPIFNSGTAFGLPPDAYNQIWQNQMQQELLNSQIQYQQQQMELQRQQILYQQQQMEFQRQQNPYAGCLMVGEVSGKDIEETKNLAQQLGANAVLFTLVTSKYVNAKAYACPVNR